jgi:MFS superfamily sulfate permease-like transporter
LQGVIKDSIVITLTFVGFCFINIEVATLMGIVCTVLLLTRCSIRYYDRGVLAEPNGNLNKNQTVFPKGAYVFNLKSFIVCISFAKNSFS